MIEKHQMMFELVDYLNERNNPDYEQNPEELIAHFPFRFTTYGDEAAIIFKATTGVDTVNNPCKSKNEILEEFRHELQHMLPAIRSALWAVNQGLKEEI